MDQQKEHSMDQEREHSMDKRFAKPILLAVAAILLVPLSAAAQSTLAGLVQDAGGGVLPGVTVEAASPALIEQVRVVVTDGQGRYTIVDLRPGVYTATFSLPGFSTLIREGLALGADVTVTVNAEMSLGSLEETITVTGASPLVDVQQAARTQVLDRATLDALPVSRNAMSIANLIPGIRMRNPDIGGSNVTSQPVLIGHGVGRKGQLQLVDGMQIATFEDNWMFYFDESSQSEVSITTSAISVESPTGGVAINSILKDGGNTFAGDIYLGGTDGTWTADNVSGNDNLQARGVRQGSEIQAIKYFTGSYGGPIFRDKLWFILGARHAGNDKTVPNTPKEVTTPQGEVISAIRDDYIRNVSVRLTWQVTPRQKFATFVQRVFKKLGHSFSFGTDPRNAYSRNPQEAHNYLTTNKWTMTPNSNWLLEAGYVISVFDWKSGPADRSRVYARGTPEWFAGAERRDTALNINPRCAYSFGCNFWVSREIGYTTAGRHHSMAAMSYVTGTHNFKVGFSNNMGEDGRTYERNADLVQRYVNNRPTSVDVVNTPFSAPGRVDYDVGLYAQDSWTTGRWTLNPGVRVEWFRSSMSESSMDAGRFAPARFFPRFVAPSFGPSVAPRITAVYDLSGDARTALKVSVAKYNEQHTARSFAHRYADGARTTDRRNWSDCDLLSGTSTCSGLTLPTNGDDIAQDNEIGPSSSPNFGRTADISPDPDLSRMYNWEYTVGVDHELRPGVAVGATYYRRTYGNIQNTDRTLISAADYTSFQTPIPDFAQDPDLQGVLDPNEILTVYNLDPAKRSEFALAQVDYNSDDEFTYDGIEFRVQARFGDGGTLMGSTTTEKSISTFCDTTDDNPNGRAVRDELYLRVDAPNGGRFCDQRQFDIPWKTEFKLAFNYPLPFGTSAAAVLQSFPGLPRTITYTVPRGLFPGGRTNSEEIILNEPGSLYYERWNQLDISFKKSIRLGAGQQLTGELDVYNVLNAASIWSMIDSIGGSLGTVTNTLPGRMLRLAVGLRF